MYKFQAIFGIAIVWIRVCCAIENVNILEKDCSFIFDSPKLIDNIDQFHGFKRGIFMGNSVDQTFKREDVNCITLVVSSVSNLSDVIKKMDVYFETRKKYVSVMAQNHPDEKELRYWKRIACQFLHIGMEFYIEKYYFRIATSNDLCFNERNQIKAIGISINPYLLNSTLGMTGINWIILQSVTKKLGMNTSKVTLIRSWDGIIQKVANGSFDIGLAHLTRNPVRVIIVDFSSFTHPLELVFVSQRPSPVTSYRTLTIPFDPYTWILIIIACIGITVIVVSIDYILLENQSVHYIYESVCVVLSPLVQQSQPQHWYQRNLNATKCLTMYIWLMSALVLGLSYECNLLSILATVRYGRPVEGIEDIINNDLTLYLGKDAAITRTLFKNSPDPIMVKAYKENSVAKDALYKRGDVEQLHKLIATDSKIVKMGTRNQIKRPGSNRFYFSKETISSQFTAFVFPKKHWLEPHVSNVIMHFQSGGIYNHLVEKFLQTENKLSQSILNKNIKKLSINQLLVTIFVHGFGLGLSVIAFAMENIIHQNNL